ncbi:C4-dicarboxylate ABC transporter substrate-binding protein [Oligella urethralis]|uniref:TAXI family TRAP transporter solute-binding subunit n=1 Tax=Oligella urethralis TaxID=90245 RepID=UPI000CFFCAC0|nr:TAXI family TRAP transporter solute-binding subunit [Oligella urethralis]AVL71544.1 C4-dicarboxylate ABC transporter substrate-binding protein [Oligella urethralis]
MLKKSVLLAAAAFTLAACSDDAKDSSTTAEPQQSAAEAPASTASDKLETRFVTIATGGASGPYNIIATALAEQYNKAYGVNSKTQTTGASVENINLINQDKVQMAFVMSDVLTDAINGENSFPAKIDKVQQIAALYPNYVQVVTSKRSGIKTLEDLRGKRVAVGDQNSGVEVNARNLINGFGMTYDDLRVDYLGYAEAADALKAGRIDAAFLTSGLPNASLMELQQSFDLQMVEIPADRIADIAKDKPYFVSLNIPAGTYGNDTDIPTAAIQNALVIHKDISEDDGYKLTKTFFESLEHLKSAHQAAGAITLEGAQSGLVAPLHPGAKKYYDEVAK